MSVYKIPHFARIQIIRDGSTAFAGADRPLASSPRDVARVACALIGANIHEEMIVIGLDARNRVVATATISIGGIHACATRASDIIRSVLLLGVSAFLIAHNHPGGDPTPSAEDVLFTPKVTAAADAVGISFIDHVIVVADGSFVSFLERGLL